MAYIYSAGIIVKVSTVYNITNWPFSQTNSFSLDPAGAGAGEGVSYSGIHVNDGSASVGVVDHMVHQRVHLSVDHCFCHLTPVEGRL